MMSGNIGKRRLLQVLFLTILLVIKEKTRTSDYTRVTLPDFNALALT